MSVKKIGNINHEHGCLLVKNENGKFFWSIEATTFEKWQEIPKSLYIQLISFEESY